MQLRFSSAATITGLIAVVAAALTGCGAGRGDSADIEPITRTTFVSTIVDTNATPSPSSTPQVIAVSVSPSSVPTSSASASSVPASPGSTSTTIASATSNAPAPTSSPSAPAPVVGSATMNRLSETEALLAGLDAQLQSASDDAASESM